jgi:hypothetical protein
MIMKKAYALFLLFALPCVMPAEAQEHCDPADTLAQCWAKLGNGFPSAAPAAQAATVSAVKADQAQKTEAAANTGVPALVTPTPSSLTDFLSLLSTTLQSSTFKSQGDTLTFDYNPPVAILGADHALKFEAAFVKPKLNDKVKDGLGSNAAALKKFDDSLANTDDATFSAALQPTSQTFGRSIAPHRQMFVAMEAAVLMKNNSLADNNNALEEALIAAGVSAETQPFSDLGDKGAAFEDAARQQAALAKSLTAFDRSFIKLLNNQPQLFFTAIYEARRNIVGPNEWTAKLTYEMSSRNLNGFRKGPGAACSSPPPDAAAGCAAALVTYADEPKLADDRLAVSAEYHHMDRRWIADSASGLAFGYPSVKSLVYSITYGRTMVGTMTTPNNGRIDLALQYEDRRNGADPTKDVRSRATGSITYTQKLSDNVSFPISLVYANHASDLANVDRKLNVHFGIIFKMPAMPVK